jgi:hypothetical protein
VPSEEPSVRDVLSPQRISLLLETLGEASLCEAFRIYLRQAHLDLEGLIAHHRARELVAAERRSHDLKGASANLGVVQVNHWATAVNALLKIGALDEVGPLLQPMARALDEATVEIMDMLGD